MTGCMGCQAARLGASVYRRGNERAIRTGTRTGAASAPARTGTLNGRREPADSLSTDRTMRLTCCLRNWMLARMTGLLSGPCAFLYRMTEQAACRFHGAAVGICENNVKY